MTTTFEAVAEIIVDTSDIPLEEITPEKNAFTDLGIDSLDFLDIAFAIDKQFGIKIPLEQWTEELNENNADVDEYFVLSKLCERIDGLVAAKEA
jgi:acyl carrier protein